MGQLKEIHQAVITLAAEGREVLGVKIAVRIGTQTGKEGVLTGGKAELCDVFMTDFLAVQRDRALMGQKAEDTFHQGGFACAVFAEQTDDLAPRQLQ